MNDFNRRLKRWIDIGVVAFVCGFSLTMIFETGTVTAGFWPRYAATTLIGFGLAMVVVGVIYLRSLSD